MKNVELATAFINKGLKRIRNLIFIEKCYYFDYPILKRKFDFDVLSREETVRRIVDEKLSVSRFGDGELSMIMQMEDTGFQEADERLAERLYEVLNADEKGMLVCITDIMLRNSGYVRKTLRYHAAYVVKKHEQLKSTIPSGRVYGSAGFTRFYADFKNKNRTLMKNRIESIQSIWGGVRRSCC